jgi:hypothetical protein
VPNKDRPALNKILVCTNMFEKLPDSDATIYAVIIDVNNVTFYEIYIFIHTQSLCDILT